jgi:predicted ATPase
MKIAALRASDVHGYLPIDVTFNDDLTFLTGLNGSGKTTALRLLMALLTPNFTELGSIVFTFAEVVVVESGSEIKVSVIKSTDGIRLNVSGIESALFLGRSELELMQPKRGEEPRIQLQDLFKSNPVISEIARLATPMFLGLDRRFFAPGAVGVPDDMEEARRRELMARRYWPEESALRGPVAPAVASLIEVNYLVVSRMQDIRVSQEHLDDKLRSEFFKKAFEYKPGNFAAENSITVPSRVEVNGYREQLKKIEKAAEGVAIPMPEIQAALNHFFERMTSVIGAFDKWALNNGNKKDVKRGQAAAKGAADLQSHHIEWIVNRPQADRILEHLQLLNEYIEKRDQLRAPIERFQSLVNDFLQQTGKRVVVAKSGQLSVTVEGSVDEHSISALSSGERQLLVMLAHLSLNLNLAGSGVFIVDEPELSLHIDWQERFVDAIQEANPNVQIILATHSPAIILDRDENCKALRVVKDA